MGNDLGAKPEVNRVVNAPRLGLEAELFTLFSGWTFQGYVKGAYRMADGTQSLDESAAYVVVCDELRIAELEQLLRDFKSKTSQETIYLEIQRDVDVRFV